MSAYERLKERYELGQVPWDHELPPPEVLTELADMVPGRALDLGCGYGRAAIYMGQLNWQVDGVDFIDLALQEATRRAAQVGVSEQVRFYHTAVTHMPALSGPYDFALDVGCMHNFNAAEMRAYHGELCRLLRTGALYLLFAHVRGDDEEDDGRWIDEQELLTLFNDGFTLEKVEHGLTQVEDRPAWHSAWFWFRRA